MSDERHTVYRRGIATIAIGKNGVSAATMRKGARENLISEVAAGSADPRCLIGCCYRPLLQGVSGTDAAIWTRQVYARRAFQASKFRIGQHR